VVGGMKKVLPLAVGELEGLPLVNLSRFSIRENTSDTITASKQSLGNVILNKSI
jgi:hypothetical protein